eukprot:Rmarinus@m.12298
MEEPVSVSLGDDVPYSELESRPFRFRSFIMDQLEDGRTIGRSRVFPPLLTGVINLTNLVLLIYALSYNGGIEPHSDNASLGPSDATLLDVGGKCVRKIRESDEWWRLISAMFLHTGIIHFAVNAAAIRVIGQLIEVEIGCLRMFLVYVLSGFTGNLASAAFHPRVITVGASGALLGVVGTGLSDLTMNWHRTPDAPHMLGSYVFIIGVSVATGFFQQADNYAHVGGLITGYLLGFIFFPIYLDKPNAYEWYQKPTVRMPLPLLGVVALLVTGVQLVLHQPRDWLDSNGNLKYLC